jgi:hypothetical protein
MWKQACVMSVEYNKRNSNLNCKTIFGDPIVSRVPVLASLTNYLLHTHRLQSKSMWVDRRKLVRASTGTLDTIEFPKTVWPFRFMFLLLYSTLMTHACFHIFPSLRPRSRSSSASSLSLLLASSLLLPTGGLQPGHVMDRFQLFLR